MQKVPNCDGTDCDCTNILLFVKCQHKSIAAPPPAPTGVPFEVWGGPSPSLGQGTKLKRGLRSLSKSQNAEMTVSGLASGPCCPLLLGACTVAYGCWTEAHHSAVVLWGTEEVTNGHFGLVAHSFPGSAHCQCALHLGHASGCGMCVTLSKAKQQNCTLAVIQTTHPALPKQR